MWHRLPSGGKWETEICQPVEIVWELGWWTFEWGSNWKVPKMLNLPFTHTLSYREVTRIIKWLCLCSLLLWQKHYLFCKVRNMAHFPSCLNNSAYSEQYLLIYSSVHFMRPCVEFLECSTPPLPSATLRGYMQRASCQSRRRTISISVISVLSANQQSTLLNQEHSMWIALAHKSFLVWDMWLSWNKICVLHITQVRIWLLFGSLSLGYLPSYHGQKSPI